MSETHKIRKKQGLCACGNEMDRDGYYCVSCNDKWNKWKHTQKCEFHEEGKCVNCGIDMDRIGWFCSKCVKKLKLRARDRNLYRRENGLCVQCGNPAEDDRSQCRKCLDQLKERRLKRKLRGVKMSEPKAKYIAKKEEVLFKELNNVNKKLKEIANWHSLSDYELTFQDRKEIELYTQLVNNIYFNLKELLINTHSFDLASNLKELITDEKTLDLAELETKRIELNNSKL